MNKIREFLLLSHLKNKLKHPTNSIFNLNFNKFNREFLKYFRNESN